MTDGRLKAAFVVSRAIKGTRIGAEVTDTLEGYELPILTARAVMMKSHKNSIE